MHAGKLGQVTNFTTVGGNAKHCVDQYMFFRYCSLEADTAMPGGLHARLCHMHFSYFGAVRTDSVKGVRGTATTYADWLQIASIICRVSRLTDCHRFSSHRPTWLDSTVELFPVRRCKLNISIWRGHCDGLRCFGDTDKHCWSYNYNDSCVFSCVNSH